MLEVDVEARVREGFGKGAARSLRRSGMTPAVLYGSKIEPVPLAVDTHSFTKTLLSIHRRNAVIHLTVDKDGQSERHHVITKEIQTDPVADTVLHADFYEISLDEPLVFHVPIRFTGKAKGVDMGGDMIVAMEQVPLKGKPLDIPDEIVVDVSGLGLGAKITCSELPLPPGVELVVEPETVCVSITGAAEE